MSNTRRALWGVLLAAACVAVTANVVAPDSELASVTYLMAVCLPPLLAAVVISRGPRQDGAAWLVVAGLASSALGDLGWEYQVRWGGGEPDVSLSDVGWLAAYVLLGAAAVVLIRRSDYRLRRDPDALIDMGVVAVLAALVIWLVWVEPTLATSDVPLGVKSVWAMYPVLDAALLALLARLVVHRSVRSPATILLAGGLACWLAADTLFISVEARGWSIVANVGWMVGSMVLGIAACALASGRDAPVEPRPVVAGVRRPVPQWRVVAAMVPLTVPWLLGVGVIAWGWRIDPVPLVVAGVALAALVVARMMLLLHSQRANEHLYMMMAENSADATLIVSDRGILLRDAPGLDALLRTDGLGVAGADIAALAARTVGAGQWFTEVVDRVMEHPGAVVERELCARVGHGEEVWLAARLVNLLHEADVQAVLINLHDITDRKRIERQLEHQAFHDPLTGLPNRALFRDRLGHAFEQRARSGWDPAVLFIDLDGFKAVNDRLGHAAGDELLQAVGIRLGRAVRSGDTIARLGGDEFAILVEHAQDPLRDARAVAARVEAELATPVPVGAVDVPVTVSIGIAPGTADATPESMLRDADTAMYHAKSAGRARTVVYSGAMKRLDGVRLQVEADLPGACAAGQLRVEYQPVVALDSGTVLGFEALLRWTHPQLGELSPELFVPIAESTGAIVPIGRWVLATACRQLAQWHDEVDPSLTMAVNVSGRQLVAHDLCRDVGDVLAETGLAAEQLVLEITETTIIGDMDEARSTLLDLRAIGVQIAVDDFGTGYSSLSYLQQLPVDVLKIDRSFMSGVRPGAELPDIVRGILDLARRLGLATIAEGVETDAQVSELVRHGCEVGQGYLFSRPLPVDAATQLLHERHRPWHPGVAEGLPTGLPV